jgi:hypothetical protein
VLQRAIPNVFVINGPPDSSISSTFNVEELVAYPIHIILPNDPLKEPPHFPNIYPIQQA